MPLPDREPAPNAESQDLCSAQRAVLGRRRRRRHVVAGIARAAIALLVTLLASVIDRGSGSDDHLGAVAAPSCSTSRPTWVLVIDMLAYSRSAR